MVYWSGPAGQLRVRFHETTATHNRHNNGNGFLRRLRPLLLQVLADPFVARHGHSFGGFITDYTAVLHLSTAGTNSNPKSNTATPAGYVTKLPCPPQLVAALEARQSWRNLARHLDDVAALAAVPVNLAHRLLASASRTSHTQHQSAAGIVNRGPILIYSKQKH